MKRLTEIFRTINDGHRVTSEELLPLVYDELRRMAASKLVHERPGQTLEATALVHEAWMRLVDGQTGQGWENRRHFFGAAAEAMRRILIEQARHRSALKNGGDRLRESLPDGSVIAAPAEVQESQVDLIALDEALKKLEIQHPRKAELVKLRYFAGLTIEQAAESLGIAASTANADWVYARSWLRVELRDS